MGLRPPNELFYHRKCSVAYVQVHSEVIDLTSDVSESAPAGVRIGMSIRCGFKQVWRYRRVWRLSWFKPSPIGKVSLP